MDRMKNTILILITIAAFLAAIATVPERVLEEDWVYDTVSSATLTTTEEYLEVN